MSLVKQNTVATIVTSHTTRCGETNEARSDLYSLLASTTPLAEAGTATTCISTRAALIVPTK